MFTPREFRKVFALTAATPVPELTVGDGDGFGEGLAEGEGEGDGLTVGLGEGEGLAEGEALTEGDGLGEGLIEGEGLGDGLTDCEGDGDGLGDDDQKFDPGFGLKNEMPDPNAKADFESVQNKVIAPRTTNPVFFFIPLHPLTRLYDDGKATDHCVRID